MLWQYSAWRRRRVARYGMHYRAWRMRLVGGYSTFPRMSSGRTASSPAGVRTVHTLSQYRTPRSTRVAPYAMPVPGIVQQAHSTTHFVSTWHRVARA
eukprot:3500549-Rhodomonas_salina.1